MIFAICVSFSDIYLQPSWSTYIQVMTFEQAETCPFNPFDLTKVTQCTLLFTLLFIKRSLSLLLSPSVIQPSYRYLYSIVFGPVLAGHLFITATDTPLMVPTLDTRFHCAGAVYQTLCLQKTVA